MSLVAATGGEGQGAPGADAADDYADDDSSRGAEDSDDDEEYGGDDTASSDDGSSSSSSSDDSDRSDSEEQGVPAGNEGGLQLLAPDEQELLDTTAAQHAEGRDMQGIPWERLQVTRATYRQQRLQRYRNYTNTIPEAECAAVRAELVHGWPQPTQLAVPQWPFAFFRNWRAVPSTIVHFQLRNLLVAPSASDVLCVYDNRVQHWSAATRVTSDVLDLRGQPRGPRLPGLGNVQVSTIAVQDSLLAAGGFNGELVLADMHQGDAGGSAWADEAHEHQQQQQQQGRSGSAWWRAEQEQAMQQAQAAASQLYGGGQPGGARPAAHARQQQQQPSASPAATSPRHHQPSRAQLPAPLLQPRQQQQQQQHRHHVHGSPPTGQCQQQQQQQWTPQQPQQQGKQPWRQRTSAGPAGWLGSCSGGGEEDEDDIVRGAVGPAAARLLHSCRVTQSDNAITNGVEIFDSPSAGRCVMASNNDAALRLFDIAQGCRPRQRLSFDFPVNYATLRPAGAAPGGGAVAAVVGDDPNTHVVDIRTGLEVLKLSGHRDFSFAAAWHPAGALLATGSQDCTTRVYDLRWPDRPLAVLGGQMGAIRSLRFSADGAFLAAAEPADFVHIYNVAGGSLSSVQQIDVFGELAGVAFSPDTQALFVAVSDALSSLLEFSRGGGHGVGGGGGWLAA